MDPEDASPCLVAARYIVLLIRGPQRRIKGGHGGFVPHLWTSEIDGILRSFMGVSLDERKLCFSTNLETQLCLKNKFSS